MESGATIHQRRFNAA